jgi:3-dehydroquinate synthetase
MKKLRVNLEGRSYPVYVGDGALAQAGSLCKVLGFESAPLVVSNARVMRLHGARLLSRSRDSDRGRGAFQKPGYAHENLRKDDSGWCRPEILGCRLRRRSGR